LVDLHNFKVMRVFPHGTTCQKILQPASNLSAEVNTFEKIVGRLNALLLSMIGTFEINHEASEQTSESQLKELAGLFKLLQGVEEMLKRIQENRDRRQQSGVDALEFRRKLEEQIAQLVDEDAEDKLS